MGIRSKLLDFKRRLSDRKMYSIVLLVIGAVSIWGIYQYKRAADLRQQLDNQYNRAIVEMTGYVNNVEMMLMKSLIASTPQKVAETLQEAWRQANLAEANLGQLPVSQPVLSKTSKFLTQVGDLSYALNNQNMYGNELSEDQYNTIKKLHGFAKSLGESLDHLIDEIYGGRIRWGELQKKGRPIFSRTSKKMPNQRFEDIDKTFKEYPTLIYDGPFSDHMTSVKPRGLTGDNVTAKEAEKAVRKFVGEDRINTIKKTAETDSEPFSVYSFEVTLKNRPEDEPMLIDITKKGGHVYWMLYNRNVPSEKLNVDEAKKVGKKFLKDKGYENMVDTYYIKEDNTATINYAYKQGDVVCYPDLIKVKVALDTGEIVGFEAKGYLASHGERDIPEPKITEEEAKAKISDRLEILSSGRAIIPTDYKKEISTYEFKGKLDDSEFLIYINAETGKEEDILMIIDSPNGILTM